MNKKLLSSSGVVVSLTAKAGENGLHKTRKRDGHPKTNYFRGGFQTFWRKNWTSKMYDKASSAQLFVSPEAVCWKALCSKGNTSSNGGCFIVMFFVGGVPFLHMIYTSSRISKVISAVVTPCCYPKRRCQISPKKSKFPMNQTPWNAKKTRRISPFNPAPSFWYISKVEQRVYPWKMVGKGRLLPSLLAFGKTFQG